MGSSIMDITPVVLRHDHFGFGLDCRKEVRGGREGGGGKASSRKEEDCVLSSGGFVLLNVYV